MKSALIVNLFIAAGIAAAGCGRRDPVVAEYRTYGRADGTWTLEFHASGLCRSSLDHGSMRFVGTFTTNSRGDRIVIHDESDYILAKAARVVQGQTNLHSTTFFLLSTNNTTYLVTELAYRKYTKTGDSSALNEEFRKIR